MEEKESVHMISVICPNKDCEFFQDAIESILNQTYKDFELIVVLDNCSKEWLQKNDNYIGLLQLRKNTIVEEKVDGEPSIPSARNRGLQLANGDYIAYLSADDVWHPNFLERMMEEAIKTNKKIVYADYYRINGAGENIGYTKELVFDRNEDFIIHLFKRCCINASALLIAREVFDKVGNFDEEILYGEDYLFYLKAAKFFEFAHIPEFLIDYRMHGKQMTQDGKNAEYDKILLEKARRFWDEMQT